MEIEKMFASKSYLRKIWKAKIELNSAEIEKRKLKVEKQKRKVEDLVSNENHHPTAVKNEKICAKFKFHFARNIILAESTADPKFATLDGKL
jgi:hypothetical protein